MLQKSLSKYCPLPDCFHIQILTLIRLLPYGLSHYWPSSDSYHSHSFRPDIYQRIHSLTNYLYQTVTTLIAKTIGLLSDSNRSRCPSKGFNQTVTTLGFIICDHTDSSDTCFYQTVTRLCHSTRTGLLLSDCYYTHSPSTSLYETATTTIVPVLTFIRLLPHSKFKYRFYQTLTTLLAYVKPCI